MWRSRADEVIERILDAQGLHFSDTLYVASLVIVLVPGMILSSFFGVCGASKKYKFLSTALVSSMLIFLATIAMFAGAEVDASYAVVISALIGKTALVTNFFFTDQIAFPSLAIFTNLTLCLLIDAICRAPLVYLPRLVVFLTAVVVSIFITLGTSYAGTKDNGANSIFVRWSIYWNCLNVQMPILSSFIFMSGISYLGLATGLCGSSPLDPVAVFSATTHFSWKSLYHVTLLVFWLTTTVIGVKVQTDYFPLVPNSLFFKGNCERIEPPSKTMTPEPPVEDVVPLLDSTGMDP